MSIRVGILSYDFPPARGGQGRHAEIVARYFDGDSEIEAVVFSPEKVHSTRQGTEQYQIFKWTKRAPLKNLLFSFCINIFLDSLVRKHHLDILLVNGGPGGVLLVRNPKVPLVSIANHTYAQQASLVPEQWWKRIFVPFERSGYQRSKLIVAISKSTAQSVCDDYGIDPGRVRVQPVSISPLPGSITLENRRDGQILFVGRLDHRKGVDFLAKAFVQFTKRYPHAELILCGKGKLQASLYNTFQGEGVLEQVRFVSEASDEELQKLFEHAAVLAVPSRFEGLGIVALEALRFGTPVVATDVPGLSETVLPGKTGWLVPFGDVSKFCDALHEANTSVQSKEYPVETCRLFLRERFSPEDAKRNFTSWIRELVTE